MDLVKYIKNGGYYAAYGNLKYRVEGLSGIGTLTFTTTYDGAAYTAKVPVIGGVAELSVNSQVTPLRTKSNTLYNRTALGAESPTTVTIEYTFGTTHIVTIYILNILVQPDTAIFGNNFLTPARKHLVSPYFEAGIWFFGNKTALVTDGNGVVHSTTGTANKLNFLSFRNTSPTGTPLSQFAKAQIGDGDAVSIEYDTLNRYDAMALKYKGLSGGYQYLFFTGEKEITPKPVGGEKMEFGDGTYMVGGTLAMGFLLKRDMYSVRDVGMLTELSQAQNAWLAPYWQFSPFTVTLDQYATGAGYRVVEFAPTDAQHNELSRVFAINDAVRFELVGQPYTVLGMWGTIVQISASAFRVHFISQHGNDDLTTLDAWVSGAVQLRIVRENAWYPVRVTPKWSLTGDAPTMSFTVDVETNEFQKFNI